MHTKSLPVKRYTNGESPLEMPNLNDCCGDKEWKLQSLHVNLYLRSCVVLLLSMLVYVFVFVL